MSGMGVSAGAAVADARVECTNTLAGLVRALSDLPEWRGTLAENQLERRVVFRAAPPFSGGTRIGRPLADEDYDRIRLWFETERGLRVSRGNLEDAVRLVAAENAFHPVRVYLEGLVWDGVSRVDTWLEDFCAVVPRGPEHRAMLRSVARKWLVSCVARGMTPGCKADTMLILEGAQGIGKSSALRALAGEDFFCDSLLDVGTKEACQTIQGIWIYELSELDAILRAESSVTKSFLSRSFDRFRVPYGRAPKSIPRSVVFCGTVNHGGYLKDRTGNRRFWVVRCEGPLSTEALRAARDQLWAEACLLYREGEAWHLDAVDEATMREEQAARLDGDPWEDIVSSWTARRGPTSFAMNELLESALGMKAHGRNPSVTSRVSRILERLGFERRRAMTGGTRSYFYERALPHCPTAPLDSR